LRSAVAWERAGATISAPFAGVHIVEATKQVYRAIPARRERRRLVPVLPPVLAPTRGAAALLFSSRGDLLAAHPQESGDPGAHSNLA